MVKNNELALTPERYKRLRETLSQCDPFKSQADLYAVFSDPRLTPWQSRLPAADNCNSRVWITINFLQGRKNSTGASALVLLLQVLSELIDPGDALHDELLDLASELEQVSKPDRETEESQASLPSPEFSDVSVSSLNTPRDKVHAPALLESSIVRIYGKHQQSIGAGFWVGKERILTCVHVVESALGLSGSLSDMPVGDIRLDFPLLAPEQVLTARVVQWRPKIDVAILELIHPAPTNSQPVNMMTTLDVWGHDFHVVGFPVGHEDGNWVSGILRGPRADGWVQMEVTSQSGYLVAPGFSGSPVWDEQLGGVVGMVVAADTTEGIKAAFLIPARILQSVMPPEIPEMVLIPAGEFWMGSELNDPLAFSNEVPRRKLNLPTYAISKYPVTNAEYLAFVLATGHRSPEHWPSRNQAPRGKERHPVVNIHLKDAQVYCDWLTEVTGKRYRLPTEEEWEKTARGASPEMRRYPWGDTWDFSYANTKNSDPDDTTPVDAFEEKNRSPFGVVDMVGNVWEWTSTSYKGDRHVIRGGSFRYDVKYARNSCRGRCAPEKVDPDLGFRIVRIVGGE